MIDTPRLWARGFQGGNPGAPGTGFRRKPVHRVEFKCRIHAEIRQGARATSFCNPARGFRVRRPATGVLQGYGVDHLAAQDTGTAGLAARYAAALFDLAEEARALDAVADDLRQLRAMIASSPDLLRLLRSPVLSRSEQSRALAAVLSQAGAGDLTKRFVGLVAENRRLFALSDMIEAFLADLARRRGEVTASVTSAAPLSEEQQAHLAEALRRVLGAKVSVELKTDRSLIGGLLVKVGSRLVDSSLKSKLQRLQLVMKGVG
jgi:F-type H+-transporting ATPase subunit delta